MSDETKKVEENAYPLALAEGDAVLSTSALADLGLIMPIATPQMLRAAFAEKQRLYAAILDEHDYIYSISYIEQQKQKQAIYSNRADAEKASATYGVPYRASPKKSGIVKLAAALGIQAVRKQTSGLPSDPAATFSYVLYEATHKRTGRTEEGIGWCDTKERHKLHDIIATADTRAYNRAVLRLAGFGDVSADEILAGASTDDALPVIVLDSQQKKPAALPPPTDDVVKIAMRSWAQEADKRGDLAPVAQQTGQAARELRAKARRGSESAARALGAQGFAWEGQASDGLGYEPFVVETPTILPSDFAKLREAAKDQAPIAPTEPGWNLSGAGSATDDKKPGAPTETTRERAAAGVASPSAEMGADTITTAQAKVLSESLLSKLGTKDAAREWLQKNAGVDRSVKVQSHQYESVMNKLKKEG